MDENENKVIPFPGMPEALPATAVPNTLCKHLNKVALLNNVQIPIKIKKKVFLWTVEIRLVITINIAFCNDCKQVLPNINLSGSGFELYQMVPKGNMIEEKRLI